MKHGKNFYSRSSFLKPAVSLCLLSAAVLGCKIPDQGLPDPGASTLPDGGACYTEDFPRQTQQSKSLDLLFVTDTSASLLNKKKRIAAGIDAFVSELPPDVDYQIAVMPAHGSRSPYSGRLYKFWSSPYVLRSKDMSLEEIRNDLHDDLVYAPSDYWADGGEEGLYSLYHAMDPGNLQSNRAYGFFRPNAALAVVFISDEQDICATYPAGVQKVPDPEGLEELANARDCKGITPNSVLARLQQLQGGRPLIVSGIVYDNLATVPHERDLQDEYGYGYMDLIQLAKGFSVDIAGGNYDIGLRQIADFSNQQMQPTVDFKLAHSPVDQSTISVSLLSAQDGTGDGSGSCSSDDGDGDHDHDDHCGCDDQGDHHDDGGWSLGQSSHGSHGRGIASQPSPTPSSTGRVVDFSFNADTNTVHLLDPTAPEPVARISYCLVQPSPTPSPSDTVTPSPTPSDTVTPSPTPSDTVTPSPTPSDTVTPSPTPSDTVTPSPTPSDTVTPSPSPSATATPSPSPSATATPSPSPTCSGPFCGGGPNGS